MKNYYEILELDSSASFKDIRAAYRRLSKQYHPDLNPNNPFVEEQFHDIQEAYNVLKDGIRRELFDEHLRELGIKQSPFQRLRYFVKKSLRKDEEIWVDEEDEEGPIRPIVRRRPRGINKAILAIAALIVVVIVIFFLEARMDNTPYTNQTLSFETKQDNTEQQSLVEKYKLPEELVIKKIPKSNDKINSTPEDAARSRKLQRVKSELEGQGAAPVVSTEEGKGASQPSTENRARSFRPEQASEAVAPVMEVRKPTVDVNKVYMEVDKKPTFAGGAPAFVDYLNKNLNYPKTAREDNISGRVLVTFIVERNGQISNVSVVQGIGGGCDEEAIRVMKNAPTWQPGELNGEPVRVRATIPITFRLN